MTFFKPHVLRTVGIALMVMFSGNAQAAQISSGQFCVGGICLTDDIKKHPDLYAHHVKQINSRQCLARKPSVDLTGELAVNGRPYRYGLNYYINSAGEVSLRVESLTWMAQDNHPNEFNYIFKRYLTKYPGVKPSGKSESEFIWAAPNQQEGVIIQADQNPQSLRIRYALDQRSQNELNFSLWLTQASCGTSVPL